MSSTAKPSEPAPAVSNYDAQFEAQLAHARRRRQLLKLGELRFGATQEQVEKACRAKLSHGDKVIFHWPQPLKPTHNHRGWVMLRFDNRDLRKEAQKELSGWKFKGRVTSCMIPAQIAVSLRRHLMPPE